MIKLRSLKLEGFLSHRQTELEFDDEAYVILGENASGKTSILRGIFFALFGKDFSSDKLERIVNRESNRLSVSLSFIHRGNLYTVNRRFSAVRKKSEAELKRNGKLHAAGVRNVNDSIEKELGLDPNIFRNTVYIPQGEILTLFEVARKEKRQILNRLLGLEEIGQKHEKVKVFISRMKTLRESLLERQRSFQELESEVKELKREIEETEMKLKKLEEEYQKEKEFLESQEKLYRRYLEKREEFKRLTESLGRVEEHLKNSSREIERLNRKIGEIEKQKTLIPRMEKEVKTLKPLKQIKSIVNRINEKRLDKKEVEAKLRELESVEKEIKELEEKLPELKKSSGELQAFLKEKIKELKETEKQLKETKEVERIYKELQIKLSEREKLLDSLEKEIGKLIHPADPESLKEKREEILKETEKVESEIALLKSRIKEAEERIRILKACENPNCPVCGSSMDREEKERVLLQSEEEIRIGKATLKSLEAKKAELKKLFNSLEKKLQESLQIKERREQLGRDREKTLLEIENLKDSLKNLHFDPKNLKKIEEFFTSLREQVAATEERERGLLKEINEAETKLKNLSSRFNIGEKEKLLKKSEELRNEIETLLNEIKRIKDASSLSVSSAKEVEEEISRLERIKEKLNKIQGEVENLDFYHDEKRKKEDMIKKLNDEISRLKEKIEQLGYSEEEFSTVEKTYQKQKEKVELLQKELSKESGKLETLKKRFNIDLEKLKRKENNLKLLGKVEDSIRIVNAIAQAIHPEKGFLQKVRRSLLPRITIYCKEFFEEFDFEFGDIDISEDLTVTFGIPGRGTMQVEEFSGGQQIAFALSLRFAMARYFAQNFELLILDEPTIHLDQQRRQSLTDLLIKLKAKIPQMIIVTHDPELEVVGDRVIRVRNVNGISEVAVE
ncbi:MAG: hypothetical protein DSY34_04760 [Desulfurobacterium sp.]|nr:MAG: hypothetical protein DSY34_04760 [Desulfurobacterium sp.]